MYGGRRRRTQSLEDQLDRADAVEAGKSPTEVPPRPAAGLPVAPHSSVGDLRVRFVVEP
jgi:hypothetical protein